MVTRRHWLRHAYLGNVPGRDAARTEVPGLGVWQGCGQHRGQHGWSPAAEREDTARSGREEGQTLLASSAAVTRGL